MTIMIHILCVFIYFITEKIVGPNVLQNKPSLIFFAPDGRGGAGGQSGACMSGAGMT